jgi:hypothetical protein
MRDPMKGEKLPEIDLVDNNDDDSDKDELPSHPRKHNVAQIPTRTNGTGRSVGLSEKR